MKSIKRIKSKKIKYLFLFMVCSFFCIEFAFSNSAIVVSPVSGTWANYQSLVIYVPKDANVFYSFTGSDPLVSGFAYDGPVLIEKTGVVNLRIATVTSEGTISEQKVSYTVNPVPTDQSFYTLASKTPLVKISSEQSFDIPNTMVYSIGDDEQPYISGRLLSVSNTNGLSRIVPILIKNDEALYRVMAQISPNEVDVNYESSDSKFPFPVTCQYWSDFTFYPGDEYSISIDNTEWLSGEVKATLDRNCSHVILYKNQKNMVSSYVLLPPKPELLRVSETSSISSPVDLIISDDRFTFAMESGKKLSSCRIDTLYGDDLAGTLDFSVYFGNIYQGKLSVTLALDKKPPKTPVFSSDSHDFYSRKPITVKLDSDGEIYYRIITPVLSDFGFDDSFVQQQAILTAEDKDTPFEKFNHGLFKLPGNKSGAVFYTVEAYALDYAGNKSDVSTFSAVVDPHNYYVVAHSVSTDKSPSDGSPNRPYSDLSKVLQMVNTNANFVRLHLDGSFLDLPQLTVKTECELLGTGGTRLEFAKECGFLLDGANLTITNCIIEQTNGSSVTTEIDNKTVTKEQIFQQDLFTINNGNLFLNGCEVVAVLGLNGTVVKGQNSLVQIMDSSITAQTKKYSALITGVNCSIDIHNSTFVSIAPTAVCFTINLGTADIKNSTCTLIGNMGRVGEFSRCDLQLTDNNFIHNVDSSITLDKTYAIWIDGRTRLLQEKNNTCSGFSSIFE